MTVGGWMCVFCGCVCVCVCVRGCVRVCARACVHAFGRLHSVVVSLLIDCKCWFLISTLIMAYCFDVCS